MSFVNLCNHSHYSILNGLAKPKDYIMKAKEFWMEAVWLTDLTNIHWAHEFYKTCKSEWINPILWVEIFVTSNSIYDTSSLNLPHNLILIAKNLKGYQNILEMITESNLEWFDWKPRIDHEILKKYKDNIIALSWPKWWEIPYYVLSWKSEEEIVERINYYLELFWEDNFYLQLLYHTDIPKQIFITERLLELHKKYNFPVVAWNYSYYVNKEDKTTQDVIMCLWTGHTMENPDRPTMIHWDYSFLSSDELSEIFKDVPEALENTRKIASMCHVEFETWGILIPKYDLPEKDQLIYNEATQLEKDEKWLKKLSSDEWYLRYLCFEGLNWRYEYQIPRGEIFELVKKLDKPNLDKKLQETSPEELKDLSKTYYTDKKKELLSKYSDDINQKIERLEYELVVVHEMWFDAYFLIVADYINWARDEWIPVWPWRGSAAWALLAFLSGITDIDPLPYNLLFERFLNPARVSMPDIDTDFSDDARDRVIAYCRNKYWADHVAQICTFWTFAARAAVKDVWRVNWVDFQEMNRLAALIPEKPGTKLAWALEDSLEFKAAYETNPLYKRIIDDALKIEWNVRQLWVHACAVIIAPNKMTNYTALQHPPKDTEAIITQSSAYPLEDLGLLKMDFLWLRNLTIIKRAIEIIKKSKWVDIDILKINLEDQKVFDVFAAWDTTWVFQFESEWMRKYLKDLAPNSFEDIIVMVSLYRPGPLQYIPTYIDRKHWREKVEYPHPSLEKILSPTQWIAVYQEQIMQMVQAFAGFSLGWADILRRAIWKKKIEVLMEQKNIFVTKAKELWHSEELALHIFEDVIEPFAGYWFNKSHAACYALIAYQTAYLKAYYETEFLTAVMTSDEENMERITMEVSEAEQKWISILPPDVKSSLKHFTYIDDKNIRFGLKAIKWLWDWPIDAIIQKREESWYSDLEDFIKKTWKDVINKRSLESLILAWAMDSFAERWEMFWNIEEMSRFVKENDKKESSSQMWFFDLWDENDFTDSLKLKPVNPFSFERKLSWEKEMIWFRVSGHPLDWLRKYCYKRSNNSSLISKSIEDYKKEEQEKIKEEEIESEKQKEKNEKPEKKKRQKQEMVKTVWVINDIFKTVTKTWKNMIIMKCEWYDWEFEVVIFDKDYDTYKDRVWIDKIVIIEWRFNVNTEYWRKSISSDSLNIANLTQVRAQAEEMWLLDDSKFSLKTNDNLPKEEEKSIIELEEDILEIQKNKQEENKIMEEYIVEIPSFAKMQDIHDLKTFLLTLENWECKIFINLKWQKIDTKIKVSDYKKIENWKNEKWKI